MVFHEIGAVHKWRQHFWGDIQIPLPLVVMSSFGYPLPLCKHKWWEELFCNKTAKIGLPIIIFSVQMLSLCLGLIWHLRSSQWDVSQIAGLPRISIILSSIPYSSDDVIYEQPHMVIIPSINSTVYVYWEILEMLDKTNDARGKVSEKNCNQH